MILSISCLCLMKVLSHQEIRGLIRPGKMISKVEHQALLTDTYGTRLVLLSYRDATSMLEHWSIALSSRGRRIARIRRLPDGCFAIRSEQQALDYVRLLTFPGTSRYFVGAYGPEIGSRSEIQKMSDYNMGGWPEIVRRAPNRTLGILPVSLLNELALPKTSVKAFQRSFFVHRAVVRRYDAATSQYLILNERVDSNGNYRVIASNALDLPGGLKFLPDVGI